MEPDDQLETTKGSLEKQRILLIFKTCPTSKHGAPIMTGPISQSLLPRRCKIRGANIREGKSFHISRVLLEGGISSTITLTASNSGKTFHYGRGMNLQSGPPSLRRKYLQPSLGVDSSTIMVCKGQNAARWGEILPPSSTVNVSHRG